MLIFGIVFHLYGTVGCCLQTVFGYALVSDCSDIATLVINIGVVIDHGIVFFDVFDCYEISGFVVSRIIEKTACNAVLTLVQKLYFL